MKPSLCTKYHAPKAVSTQGTIGYTINGHNEAAFEDNPVHDKNSDTSRPAPWYDCSGKQPGNYEHPYDCTRFITCDAGLVAIEFDCGECSNRPEACTPQNRLVYNVTVDMCLWADETECHIGGGEEKNDRSRRKWTLANLQQLI
jgi:hypothetical protein